MFYLLESQQQLEWLANKVESTLYVDVVRTNDYFHSKLTTAVGIYIRPVGDSQGYFIPVSHDDGLDVDKDRVYDILSKAEKLYTLNKKTLLYHFNLQRAIDISLLYSMNFYKRLEFSSSNSTIDWYYRKYSEKGDINKLIPIVKLYERSENIFNQIEQYLELPIPDGFDFYNNMTTNVFYLLEQNGVGIVYDGFNELFKPKNPLYNTLNNTVYTEYNLYNNTSRPTNTFNSVNFAAIPKTPEHRQCFKPQNDFFVEFDFDGYHLRLLAEQLDYPLTNETAH